MQLIQQYFPNLTQQQTQQYTLLYNLYFTWNQSINVISRKDIEQLYLRHVLHSLAIAAYYQFKPNTTIVDIGTGGGFPGLPLAIMFPEVQFTLVDSIKKKLIVVSEVAKASGIQNITTINARAEELKNKYQFVVSRAVTEFSQFYKWTKHLVSNNNINEFKNGIIYLKGGDLTAELSQWPQIIQHNIYSIFTHPFFETKKLVYLPF